MFQLLLVTILQLVCSGVFALEVREQAPKNKDYQAEISLSQVQFVFAPEGQFRQSSNDSFSQLNLGFASTHSLTSRWQSSVDANWLYSPAEHKSNYFNIKELSVERKINIGKLTFGRHLHNWSLADEDWNSAIWQPRFEWSKIRPEQNGLFGLFAEIDWQKNWTSTLSLTPFFIPNIGPNFAVVEHKFDAQNPWFSSPVSRANLPLGNNIPLAYTIHMPEISKALQQEGFALQTRWQKADRFCQVSLARKPVEQAYLAAQFSVRYDLVTSDPGVDITPFFNYQQIATAECGQSTSEWQNYLSLTRETIDQNSDIPVDSTYKQTGQTVVAAAGVRRYLDSFKKEGWNFGVMQLWGGDLDDGGKRVLQPGESLFEKRFRYLQAVQAGVFQERSVFKKTLSWNANVVYDFKQKGWWITNDLAYALRKNFRLTLAADFLALQSAAELTAEHEDDFLNVYRANDSVQVGCNYEF